MLKIIIKEIMDLNSLYSYINRDCAIEHEVLGRNAVYDIDDCEIEVCISICNYMQYRFLIQKSFFFYKCNLIVYTVCL